jgi:DNA-binding NtrC family response regulator
MKDLERDLLEEAVRMYADNKQAAGGALGMSERTLYRLLKTLALSQYRNSNIQ